MVIYFRMESYWKDMSDRTIKFRVWNRRIKKWVHGPGKEVNLFGEMILLGGFMMGVSIDELNDCIALQYTGLKDKNGVDVYEGDILKCKGHDGWFDEEGYYYNKEIKYIISESGESEISGFFYISIDREVVGNIFENPELLKNE